MKGAGAEGMFQQFVQALSDMWFLVVALVAHLIRTETRDAVFRERIQSLENQRSADMARIEVMWAEVRNDIKLLLRSKGSE